MNIIHFSTYLFLIQLVGVENTSVVDARSRKLTRSAVSRRTVEVHLQRLKWQIATDTLKKFADTGGQCTNKEHSAHGLN